MTKISSVFPDDFLWGASTSAFQVEGAAYTDGKGESIADVRAKRKAKEQMDTTISIDHYHHLEEDVQLMHELGLKSYRFSINWSRIFPNGNDVEANPAGVAFYHRLFDLLKQYAIEPIVTMYHFDMPMGLINAYEGWVSRKSIADFVCYANFLFTEYGNKVHYWLTINEQNVMAFSPDMLGITGNSPQEIFAKAQQANYHMSLAQAEVIALCHKTQIGAQIGPAISYITTLPASMKSSDLMLAKQMEDLFSFSLMDLAIKGEHSTYYLQMLKNSGVTLKTEPQDKLILKNGIADFIGVNWYCTTVIRKKSGPEANSMLENMEKIIDPDVRQTDWDWSYDPLGLRYALQQLQDRYPNFPVMITECGWSQKEELVDGQVHDSIRVDFLNDHIYQMGKAIEDGVNLISFNPWSFIDLLSVNDGMEKRYGLVYVDRDNFNERTLKRYKKDSFYFYQQVIATNGQNIKQ